MKCIQTYTTKLLLDFGGNFHADFTISVLENKERLWYAYIGNDLWIYFKSTNEE